MRFPLIRFGGDNRPFLWWEWLFAPFTLLIMGAAMLFIGAISTPLVLWMNYQQHRDEKALAKSLRAAGRVANWQEIAQKWSSGCGTLLIEQCSPNGPFREWWTEDDVIGSAPAPLPTSLDVINNPDTDWLLKYTEMCILRYTDPDNGSAMLTDVPVSVAQGLWSDFPKARVVTLVRWPEPIMMVGDPDPVI
jgi:hypothetical protein